MTVAHVLPDDVSLETALEWHFRLGCAVQRVECVLLDLQHAIDTLAVDDEVDLVDVALRGQCDAAARLSALAAVAGGLMAAAVALWEDGPFEDAVVAAQLRDQHFRAWLAECQEAVRGGGMLAPGGDAPLSHLFRVARVMRAYVARFGRRYFPGRFEVSRKLSMR